MSAPSQQTREAQMAEAVRIDRAYQALIASAPDLKTKNRVYREYRRFCQTGQVGRSVK